MNIARLWATAFIAFSVAFAEGEFKTWIGFGATSIIETGLTNGKISNGFWFFTLNGNVIDEVQIDWSPAYVPPEPSAHKLDGVVRTCGGICGTAIFDTTKSVSYNPPSAGVGFNVLQDTVISGLSGFKTSEGDVSAWGGLCVTYTSDLDIKIELDNSLTQHTLNQSGSGFGNNSDDTTCYAKPTAILPASQTGNMVKVAWSDFEQPITFKCNSKLSGEEIAKQLKSVTFSMHGGTGSYKFNICAVGPHDGTCPESCERNDITEIKKIHGGVAAMAVLNDRMLGFTGIKSTATAEILNSLGQVVAKSAIEGDATKLNLSHLDAGIYLVRVVGKSTIFTNKIVLK